VEVLLAFGRWLLAFSDWRQKRRVMTGCAGGVLESGPAFDDESGQMVIGDWLMAVDRRSPVVPCLGR